MQLNSLQNGVKRRQNIDETVTLAGGGAEPARPHLNPPLRTCDYYVVKCLILRAV